MLGPAQVCLGLDLSGRLLPGFGLAPRWETVVLAETKCHSDWSLIQNLTAELPEGDARDAFQAAVDQVEAQEDEHIRWAWETREDMIMTRAAMPTA